MKELLKKLIQTDTSIGKGELSAAQIIKEALADFGIDSQIDTWDGNRANFIAHIKSSGRKKPFLFACHLDVVPADNVGWQHPPFSAAEIDGKIFGRGAADMKGGIAAVVTAITEIVAAGRELAGDVILVAVAGEETDCCGAKRFIQNQKLPQPAGIIIPEPTDFNIVTAHRGLLWLQIETKGKAAHSSTPQLGINAISLMRLLLNELESYKPRYKPHKLLGNCAMSIDTIKGGRAINIVPDKCTIGIDFRTLPDQDSRQFIDDFQKIFRKLKDKNPEFDAEISILREVEALKTDDDCPFVRNFCRTVGTNKTETVGFTTDGPYFAKLGAPVIIFGPGKPEICHRLNEYIDISDMKKAVELYKKIITNFLTDPN